VLPRGSKIEVVTEQHRIQPRGWCPSVVPLAEAHANENAVSRAAVNRRAASWPSRPRRSPAYVVQHDELMLTAACPSSNPSAPAKR